LRKPSSPTITRLFSKSTPVSTSANDNYNNNDEKSIRLATLHSQLSSLGVDANELHNSALQSVQDPSKGYDSRFGKSAIKTYRAYLIGSTTATSTVNKKNDEMLQLQATASRVARQVEFLIKRHKSSEAEWVRHLDDDNDNCNGQGKKSRTTFPLILVLDNVRSAFNVGSLFRTADATGCTMVITTGITPHPQGSGAEKLAKSALGAERVVNHAHFGTMMDALRYLREERSGYTVIGMETTEKSKQYTMMAYPKDGCALILGNEVTGKIEPHVLPLAACTFVYVYVVSHMLSLNLHACPPPPPSYCRR
jgi:tRNA G18 (ribose-2'-O)-methylase SpoU